MRQLAILVSALLLFGASAPVFSDVIEYPFEAVAQEYYQMLLDRKFEDLDKSAADSRQKDLTISDGQPRLAAIYGGVAGCLSAGCDSSLREPEWQQRFQLLTEWRQKYPNSVTAEVAQAKVYIQHAYAIRGQGYANTVKDEAWPIFYKNIETAHVYLQGASTAAKQDPEWYATMLDVGVAQAWSQEKFNMIYLEGRKKSPIYLPIYFTASAYFSPRWHGSVSDLHHFIDDVVAVTQAKLGKTMYARLNWSLRTGTMFIDGQADWKQMKAGFERITIDFPDSWNRNNYAAFACLAQDGATVLKVAELIGDRPIESAWWGSVANYQGCVANARRSMRK